MILQYSEASPKESGKTCDLSVRGPDAVRYYGYSTVRCRLYNLNPGHGELGYFKIKTRTLLRLDPRSGNVAAQISNKVLQHSFGVGLHRTRLEYCISPS